MMITTRLHVFVSIALNVLNAINCNGFVIQDNYFSVGKSRLLRLKIRTTRIGIMADVCVVRAAGLAEWTNMSKVQRSPWFQIEREATSMYEHTQKCRESEKRRLVWQAATITVAAKAAAKRKAKTATKPRAAVPPKKPRAAVPPQKPRVAKESKRSQQWRN